MDVTMDTEVGHTMMRQSAVLVLSAMRVASGATWAAAEGSDEAPVQQPRVIEVEASQFAFEPSDIEVAVGESVRLLVHSVDVEHGFAIPSLGIGETIPPDGTPVTIEFVAGEAGRHRILCSVFCGAGHGGMGGTLSIVASSDVAPAEGGPD